MWGQPPSAVRRSEASLAQDNPKTWTFIVVSGSLVLRVDGCSKCTPTIVVSTRGNAVHELAALSSTFGRLSVLQYRELSCAETDCRCFHNSVASLRRIICAVVQGRLRRKRAELRSAPPDSRGRLSPHLA